MNKLFKVKQSVNSNPNEVEEIGVIDFIPNLYSYLKYGDGVLYQVRAIEHVIDLKSVFTNVYVVEGSKDWQGNYYIDMMSLPK